MSPQRARNASHRALNGNNHDMDVGSSGVPQDLEQRLLGIFKIAFTARFSSDLPALLQDIKGHLYERDFQKAFENEEYLEAYAVRWSASRALIYLSISYDIRDHIMQKRTAVGDGQSMAGDSSPKMTGDELELASRSANPDLADDDPNRPGARMNVACLGGGGGAEAVAWAGYTRLMHAIYPAEALSTSFDIIDVADWSVVLRQLERSIFMEPSQSAKGSAAGATSYIPLTTADQFKVNFHQCDVLNLEKSACEMLMKNSDLITLMFTLNELYTTSRARTTEFLLAISSHVKKDALLLVVDSPGSYSTVTLGSKDTAAKKRYPMQWLLDHTLLSLASTGDSHDQASWEKLVADDSRWFRLSDKLRYPIRLENTRYQLHLYRRL